MSTRLSITIPTYARAAHLTQLLNALVVELAGLEDRVEVLVSDNASPDDTPTVCADFVRRFPSARIIRNDENLGADRNMVQCFTLATGDYLWILGDDDIPKAGVVAKLLALLDTEAPDLLVMASEWHPVIKSAYQGPAIEVLDYHRLNRCDFAKATHVWLTFISGVIVRKATLVDAEPPVDLMRFLDTSVIQLGWILPALAIGERLIHVTSPCVLATGGNTGNYAVLKTFGANLPRAAADVFGRGTPEWRGVVGRTILQYLPQLVWNVRTARAGNFSAAERPWREMAAELGRFPLFWLLVLPVGIAPKPIARGVLLAARVLGWAQRARR